MYFVLGNGDALISQIGKGAAWVEVGAHRGDFSQKIFELCSPSELHLIADRAVDVREHNLFAETRAPNVKLIRANSIQGIQALPDDHFDVIYIHANHQYEYVLRDMVESRRKLKRGGIMLMNEFYEGPGGSEQNSGVIDAVNAFVKRNDFHYLAMTDGSYAALALTDDPSAPFVRQFLENLNNSDLVLIGVPDAIVPNIRYEVYKKANGDLRYLPLF